MTELVPDLLLQACERAPERPALIYQTGTMSYEHLVADAQRFANLVLDHGIAAGERVAVYLEKRFETVTAFFGTAVAGAVFVPVNPLLKPQQVAHILKDCGVRILVTSGARLQALEAVVADCVDLRTIIVVEADGAADTPRISPAPTCVRWEEVLGTEPNRREWHRRIETDMAAIFYTSGSTGMPKGVVLSHRNMVAGARSVASYLGNNPRDRLLAALPLSFDAGFSQLTTAFSAGGAVALLNYLLPADVIGAIDRYEITGLTGVPPLFIQLARARWPNGAGASLRYLANTGGAMPEPTLAWMRGQFPTSQVFLMYGLTEAFRSTYLPPAEIDRRPGSIGKAIPNVEIMVVNEQGTRCGPNEPGELVHRGPLVSLGYWNDPERTAERFRPVPAQPGELPLQEFAVWSGDIVRTDEDGFLYFLGRRDEMIKTSGNRVSPTEVEAAVYDTGLVGEAAVVGAPHLTLGQGIVLFATPRGGGTLDIAAIRDQCRERLASFMVPRVVLERPALPRNANGKIDRAALRDEVRGIFMGSEE